MQRVVSYRQGDRSEYLAQYIISAFAISVAVPRQEDVGSDFHCSLLRKENGNLRPYLPFNIQIKSFGAKEIVFGGTTDSGNWRQHEVEQLCQTDTPFLIGLVNKDEQWIDLFSTVNRYFVLYEWTGKGIPREVRLIPYEPTGENHLGSGDCEELPQLDAMPSWLWRLPIGNPIIRISISDAESEERCEAIKQVLEPYLRMDQENAVFARIGLGYFCWPLIIRTGLDLSSGGVGYRSVYPPPQRQLRVLTRIIGSLLQAYQLGGAKEKIREWEAILRQLPMESEPFVEGVIKQATAFAAE